MKHTGAKGTLIPIGGNEAKGADEDDGFDFIEAGILSQVVNQSGGVDAKIVVFPTASSIPEEVGQNYLDAFGLLGCANVEVLNVKTREEAESKYVLDSVKECDGVMLTGGDQSRIIEIIGGTKLHFLLAKRYLNEEIVIAGTSAGAMAMAHEMVAGGSATDSLVKGAVLMSKGLGLLPDFIIDTHFVQRGRYGRMAEAVATHPGLMGIGLAEDTGLIIKNHSQFEVIGSGMVLLFDPSQLTHNRHEELKLGTPMSVSNLITHILAAGDQFSFEDRKIEIYAIDKSLKK